MSSRFYILVLAYLVLLTPTTVFGQTLPFRDDFNDAHDDGSPVRWRLANDGLGSGGTRTVEDGSFIITGTGYTASFVNGTEETTDSRLEATINFLRPDGLWSFAARASGGLYSGGMFSDGRIFLGDLSPGSSITHAEEPTSFVPTDNDVSLRMDVRDIQEGVELSLYAWGENESTPSVPQLRFVDVERKYTAGTLGMFTNGGSPASVAVRHYQAAVPEPSTFCLSVFGLLGLFRYAGRARRFQA